MKIGVIGAGVMGSGVAQRFAAYEHDITLLDISEEALEVSKVTIRNNVRLAKMMKIGKQIVDMDAFWDRIHFVIDYEVLKDCDVIIENVREDIEIKKGVYEQLEKVCKEDCIYLVNTSCISITKIGSYTNRPDKVVGTHFMNPVPLKKASEVIKGYYTSEETIEKLKNLLSSVEIYPILVNDFPGFVSNRISHLLMNEAAFVVQDGCATAKDVDDIFKMCFEHKMGPLETADLIGLDTVVDSLNVLYESYHDPKFRVAPILKKMVDANLFGRKSGEGFYKY